MIINGKNIFNVGFDIFDFLIFEFVYALKVNIHGYRMRIKQLQNIEKDLPVHLSQVKEASNRK